MISFLLIICSLSRNICRSLTCVFMKSYSSSFLVTSRWHINSLSCILFLMGSAVPAISLVLSVNLRLTCVFLFLL